MAVEGDAPSTPATSASQWPRISPRRKNRVPVPIDRPAPPRRMGPRLTNAGEPLVRPASAPRRGMRPFARGLSELARQAFPDISHSDNRAIALRPKWLTKRPVMNNSSPSPILSVSITDCVANMARGRALYSTTAEFRHPGQDRDINVFIGVLGWELPSPTLRRDPLGLPTNEVHSHVNPTIQRTRGDPVDDVLRRDEVAEAVCGRQDRVLGWPSYEEGSATNLGIVCSRVNAKENDALANLVGDLH